jgi:hypothetical protein
MKTSSVFRGTASMAQLIEHPSLYHKIKGFDPTTLKGLDTHIHTHTPKHIHPNTHHTRTHTHTTFHTHTHTTHTPTTPTHTTHTHTTHTSTLIPPPPPSQKVNFREVKHFKKFLKGSKKNDRTRPKFCCRIFCFLFFLRMSFQKNECHLVLFAGRY